MPPWPETANSRFVTLCCTLFHFIQNARNIDEIRLCYTVTLLPVTLLHCYTVTPESAFLPPVSWHPAIFPFLPVSQFEQHRTGSEPASHLSECQSRTTSKHTAGVEFLRI